MFRSATALFCLLAGATLLRAEPPVASYVFPAGGQRGKTVKVRVGGLFLYKSCGFEMLGPGVTASQRLQRTKTLWFEGPMLPLPESQRAEDYPKDMAGQVTIRPDAPLGIRYWRLWTAQGATPAKKFIIGDLPEVVEQEIDGDPVPVEVQLPVTINGRIFPREDVDIWSFHAHKGQTIFCEVNAARLGSPLDAHLEIWGPDGRRLVESAGPGPDPSLRFTAPTEGLYQARIRDIRMAGGQAYVYRLTITADPHVDWVYPLGGRRGQKLWLEVSGQGLPAGPVQVQLPIKGPRDYLHHLTIAGKQTNDFLLDLDDLPEYRKEEMPASGALSAPAICNGRIEKPGARDRWSWSAHKGEVFELDLRAARLGSRLDGVLTILDGRGKELARAESPGPAQPDPKLRFQAPADGTYTVQVQDRFHSRGGKDFAYRLRIAHPGGPDFQLHLLADAVTVNRGGQGKVKITAERQGGLTGPITLAVQGLPRGVTASPLTLAAGQASVDLTFKVEKNAPIAAGRLTIRGSANVGGLTIRRTATLPAPRGLPELDSVLLAVALPTPFKIKGGDFELHLVPRGTIYQRRYKIERGGYSGPITVGLADRQARHLQGVTGPTLVVPAGATEFTYPVFLPPWMETGRTSRTCIMGVALLKDSDGQEYEVSFSSTAQNEQIVAVIEPGPLDVAVGRSSIVAMPGKRTSLPVRVARGRLLKGPAKIELIVPSHMRGVAADAIVIPADRDDGRLTLRFAAGPLGPFNMPLTVRATLTDHGRPVVAETKIEVLTQPSP
jgi:hypothetical protein